MFVEDGPDCGDVLVTFVPEAVLGALVKRLDVISEDAEWSYFRGLKEPSPGDEWTALEFDDASWDRGNSGFGYGYKGLATVLEDMKGSYTSLYLRHELQCPDLERFESFVLSVRVDDGLVAYLNGTEVGRIRAGDVGTRVPFDGKAGALAPEPLRAIKIPIQSADLKAGKNCLALQVLNQSKTSSDFALFLVLVGELVPHANRHRKSMEDFRRAAKGDDAPSRLAYLEGRLLQREGKPREAAAKFKEVISLDKTLDRARPEPFLRRAECLRAIGDPGAALAGLAEALRSGLRNERALWDLWVRISFSDLKRSAREALASLPRKVAEDDRDGADILWLLEELAGKGAIRINCGGDEYETQDGVLWSADRFFQNGYLFFGDGRGAAKEPFTSEIDGTDDDPLYQTERWFSKTSAQGVDYRVPLPSGRYRLTLYFAEIFFKDAAQRRFDVLAENAPVLEDYVAGARGFATARKETFDVRVDDGFLDLRFLRKKDNPKISAIEIRKL